MKNSTHNPLRRAARATFLGMGILLLAFPLGISAAQRGASPKLHRRAEIAVQPVYSLVVPRDMPSPVIGVAARVSLDNLKMDIVTEHQECNTPCDDPACPPLGGFFYAPVYPVYNSAAPEKTWFGKHPMQLMINTSYFKVCDQQNYHRVKCGNGSGVLVKGGKKLLGENIRDDAGNLLDAVVFWKDGRVEFLFHKDIPKDLGNAELALGGNWFFNGEEFHCGGCHEPDRRRARTALGLDAGGRTLMIVVIQPGHAARNEGLTGRELQSLMRQMGASRGFMLDGGGSSQFVYVPEKGEPWTVPPGDHQGYRPIPSAFGIVGLKDSP